MSYKLCLYVFASLHINGIYALVNEEIAKKIMNFDMQHIVHCHRSYYGTTYNRYDSPDDKKAKKLEKELKRFLILRAHDESVRMFSVEVDRLWHTFILNTEEYERFCKEAVGKPLHHKILSREERKQMDWSEEEKKFTTAYKENFGKSPSQKIWTWVKGEQRSRNVGGNQC